MEDGVASLLSMECVSGVFGGEINKQTFTGKVKKTKLLYCSENALARLVSVCEKVALRLKWEVQWAQMDRAEEVDTLAADGSSAHLE